VKREAKHGQDLVLTQEIVKDSASMWSMQLLVLVTVKAWVLLASARKSVEHFVYDQSISTFI